MSRIFLVGLDGSSGGRAALDYAIKEAGHSGVSLHLVSVVPLSLQDLTQDFGAQRAEEVVDASRQRLRESVLKPALAACQAAGVESAGEVCAGNPAQRLAALAGQRGAAAIIVGRRGMSKMKALVFGSTASNLVQLASVPVTVVPAD